MSLGLLTRASSGQCRVIGIADQGVVWAARVMGLLTRALSGRRRVIGTSSTGGSTASSRASARSKTAHFKGPPCIETSFWRFGTGPGSGGSKRLIFKGRACTESYRIVIFGLWYPSGLWGGSKRILYKGRSSAESSFLSFGTGHCVSGHVPARNITSCRVMSRHVASCHVMSCHVMPCHVASCRVMSCHVMSCHVMSCHVMSSHVMSC